LGLVWATRVFFLHRRLAVGVLFYLILLARASFPRFRYDKLIKLAWVYLLPVRLYFLIIAWLL
jgi:NADH:ubiquinone oxidoreductase subunit H